MWLDARLLTHVQTPTYLMLVHANMVSRLVLLTATGAENMSELWLYDPAFLDVVAKAHQ